MIHSVVVDASASSAAESFHIPPLVVKICAPGRTSDMLNEAASYDEMEARVFPELPVRCHADFFNTATTRGLRTTLLWIVPNQL